MHVPTLIEKKRDGRTLEPAEIDFLVAGLTDGTIPDAQWSALAMAIYFKGMTAGETWALTRAIRDSGSTLDYGTAPHPPIVDKHSTGGVGDKVSLILAPLLACDDLWVPMVSGRGLGITGGTLDKLESIPGFQVRLPESALLPQLQSIGVFMAGQTDTFCPADRRLYSLRDVTATVPSQPLIVASIMSKKLAENLDRLVLDVKFGHGAFMKTRAEAESLASAMIEVGKLAGVACTARLNPMNEPLGHAVGHALEVKECLDVLQGAGPEDLIKITLDLAQAVSTQSREQLHRWLKDGTAHQKFLQLVEIQGGNAGDLPHLTSRIHRAPVCIEVPAPNSGVIDAINADGIGRACLALGGGRSKVEDTIDYSVGFDQFAKCGQTIQASQPLCRIHARGQQDAEEASCRVLAAVSIR